MRTARADLRRTNAVASAVAGYLLALQGMSQLIDWLIDDDVVDWLRIVWLVDWLMFDCVIGTFKAPSRYWCCCSDIIMTTYCRICARTSLYDASETLHFRLFSFRFLVWFVVHWIVDFWFVFVYAVPYEMRCESKPTNAICFYHLWFSLLLLLLLGSRTRGVIRSTFCVLVFVCFLYKQTKMQKVELTTGLGTCRDKVKMLQHVLLLFWLMMILRFRALTHLHSFVCFMSPPSLCIVSSEFWRSGTRTSSACVPMKSQSLTLVFVSIVENC